MQRPIDLHYIYNISKGNQTIFPYTTYCDFQMVTLGNTQNYTVACLLTINLINEKIFQILFIVYIFLNIFSVVNLIYWLYTLFSPYLIRKISLSIDEHLLLKIIDCRLFAKHLEHELLIE